MSRHYQDFHAARYPQIMVAPEQRAEFLVKHYWDNVNFADTNYIHHPEITEQAWVELLRHSESCPPQNRTGSYTQNDRPHKRRQEVFAYITDLADKYLYDPNSPDA